MPRSLIIELPETLSERVRDAAASAGLSEEALVERTMREWLESWAEDFRRLDEPGDDIPAEAALKRFDALIESRRRSQ